MTKVLDDVLAANQSYVGEFGDKGSLALPPARRFAILTCMDARLDPAKFAGLAEGDAHVIRNAGGRASDDAIRSLIISHKLLGTDEWFVIHHTDCGMETFTDDQLRQRLATEADADASDIEFHAFPTVRDRIRQSVETIAESPLLPDSFTARGFVYDVRTGRLDEVA